MYNIRKSPVRAFAAVAAGVVLCGVCLRRSFSGIFLVLLPLLCTPLQAQDITQKTHDIEEAVVRGERRRHGTAITHSVIDSSRLSQAAGQTFAELLSHHTTLFVKSQGQGAAATVSFRGTAASHTNAEWNGLTINNPMLGQVDFSLIPVAFADEAELYYGGSSLHTGGGALGGSVVINSRPRWDDNFYGDVTQAVGSYGLYQGMTTIGGGGRKLQACARYLYEESRNDFKYLNTAVLPRRRMRQTDAGYGKHGAMLDLFWNPGNGHFLSLNLWYHTSGRNLPKMMTYEGTELFERQDDNDFRAALTWSMSRGRVQTKLVTGFASTRLDYRFQSVRGVPMSSNIDSRSTANTFQNRFSAVYTLSPTIELRGKLNIDLQKAEITANRHNSDMRNTIRPDRLESGFTASAHFNFSKHWSAFALLRVEAADEKASPLIPAVGAEFRPLGNGTLRITANAARNYHQPTLNDLYWLPGGNPDLKPERGLAADLGAAVSMDSGAFRYDISVTGYWSKIDDWIVWSVGGLHHQTTPRNLREVEIHGVEAVASTAYSVGELSLELSGNYSYTKSRNKTPGEENDAVAGRQLVYIPVHKANIILEGSWHGWYLWWIWSVTGERFTNDANVRLYGELRPYDLHDATIGKRLRLWGTELDVRLKVNNVFERQYQAILWRPMPGRNYALSLKLSF